MSINLEKLAIDKSWNEILPHLKKVFQKIKTSSEAKETYLECAHKKNMHPEGLGIAAGNYGI